MEQDRDRAAGDPRLILQPNIPVAQRKRPTGCSPLDTRSGIFDPLAPSVRGRQTIQFTVLPISSVREGACADRAVSPVESGVVQSQWDRALVDRTAATFPSDRSGQGESAPACV